MSDFFRPATRPCARKQYVCEACGWFIPVGEQHTAQSGVYDGRAFSNRFHNECWQALAADPYADDGFVTGDYLVPERFAAEVAAHRDSRMVGRQSAQPQGGDANGTR